MSAWLVPACLGFMTRKTPFHLVALGAADGMGLIADYLERPPLYSESGELLPGPEGYRDCPYPILSRTGLDPAPKPAASELFKALDVRFIACAREDMPKLIPKPAPDEGLLVFSRGCADLRVDLAPDLGFWVDMEGDELRVYRRIEGSLQNRLLAKGNVLLKGWNFLQPLGPVRRPRITIEEAPKTLEPGTYRKGRKNV